MREEKKRCIQPGCDIARPVFLPGEEKDEKKHKEELRTAAVRNRFYDTFEEAALAFVKERRAAGMKIRYSADYTAEETDGGCKITLRLSLRESGGGRKTAEYVHLWKEDVLVPPKSFLRHFSIFKSKRP